MRAVGPTANSPRVFMHDPTGAISTPCARATSAAFSRLTRTISSTRGCPLDCTIIGERFLAAISVRCT